MKTLSNENIILRTAEPYDAECIYRWENDRSIWRVSETIAPYSMHQIEQFLLNNNDLISEKQLRLMIENRNDKTPIGCIDIYDYDAFNERVGIGILIDENFRNKGFAKQAVDVLIDYCFNTLILKQIYILTFIDNLESIKLFESAGFERCGHRKQWLKTPNGFVDQLEYQLINTNKI